MTAPRTATVGQMRPTRTTTLEHPAAYPEMNIGPDGQLFHLLLQHNIEFSSPDHEQLRLRPSSKNLRHRLKKKSVTFDRVETADDPSTG